MNVHHIGITVGDLERSVAWYCTNLGFRVVDRAHVEGERISQQTELPDTAIDVALLAGSNIVLELLQYRNPIGKEFTLRTCDIGAAHICVVVDDLDSTYQAMRARGVSVHAEPTKLVGDTKMVYVRDPDGLTVELMEPHGALLLSAMLAER